MFSKIKQTGRKLLVTALAFTMLAGLPAAMGNVLSFTSTRVSALSATMTYSDFDFRVKDDGKAVIVKYNGEEADVTIPSVLYDSDAQVWYDVDEIEEGTIAANDSVEKIYVPDAIKTVRKGAFRNLNNLTLASFKGNDTVIEAYAVGYDGSYEYSANEHKMYYKYYKSSNVPDIYGPGKSCTAKNYAGNFSFPYYTIPLNSSYLSDNKGLTNEWNVVCLEGGGGKGELSYYTELYERKKYNTFIYYSKVTDIEPMEFPGNKVVYTISKPGTYRVTAVVRDANYYEVRKNLLLHIYDPLEFESEISCGENGIVSVNEPIEVSLDATSGSGNYKYKFMMKKGTITSDDIDACEYQTDNTKTFATEAAGSYQVLAYVTDTASGLSDYKIYNVKVKSDLSFTYTKSADVLVLGDTLTVELSAHNGVPPYRYSLYSKRGDGDYKMIKDRVSTSTLTYTPTESGDYTIQLLVFESTNSAVNITFPLKVHEPLENNSYLDKTSIEKGKSVTVYAVSAGGNDPVQYAVWYKKSTASSWTTAQKYSDNNRIKITPKNTGKYTISVKAKDSSGTVKKKTLTVNVLTPLTNTSTISATSISSGSTLKITASAKGGKSPYKYAVWYKKSTASSWTQAQKYSTNTTISIKPKSTGKYYISVKVKDANGTIAKKAFTVMVNTAELKNTSTIASTAITYGNTVNVNCSSTGGTGTVEYAVFYKQKTQTNWTCAQNYSTNKTVSIKPKAATSYNVRVKAKDSSGKIVNKDFVLTVSK